MEASDVLPEPRQGAVDFASDIPWLAEILDATNTYMYIFI
jgi:hypothetical protein